MKNKHRIKQGLSMLLAGGIALANLGAALPAFAEDAPATPETAEAATPETAEANVPTPNLSQITEKYWGKFSLIHQFLIKLCNKLYSTFHPKSLFLDLIFVHMNSIK